jgi:hypothetical protein
MHSTDAPTPNPGCDPRLTFQREHDPDRPGQLLLSGGEPVATVFWSHDFAERERTGWFLALLDAAGEPEQGEPTRLAVSGDVARLVADTELDRGGWLERAAAVELISATAAVEAGERELAQQLGGDGR